MIRKAVIPAGVLTLALACGALVDVSRLQAGLAEEYGDSAVKVAFVNGLHHIEVTLEDSASAGLDESTARDRAARVARFVMEHYERASELERVSVEFVVERSGLSSRSISVEFDASELR